ncbi:hypothetical protein [Streptomyces sp. NPDC004533]|uniref:hypothetical protein n=1 Tax=Streptomyces sp. NPDC004533 TaxID=3154278 RepID=UPI0033A08409
MTIENELDAHISGFHLDALSSGVSLNVDLDTTLTVVAGTFYRMLARKLPRYETAAPDKIRRHFLDATGTLHVGEHTVTCALSLRSHQPVLTDSGFPDLEIPVPWWNDRTLSSASPHAEPGRADLNQISAPGIEANSLPSVAPRARDVALRGATRPTGGAQGPAWPFGAKWSGLLLRQWSAYVDECAHTVGSRRL